MKLLVDIGNSRIKWATLDQSGLGESASFARNKTGIKAALNKAWKPLEGITEIFVANVAGEKIASQLIEWANNNWQITPEFIHAEKRRFGVSNAYEEAEKLGVDRWLSLIAARQHARQAQCIIDCGTAITIDIVTRNGQHQGGMILPGIEIMRKALFDNTDALTEQANDADFRTLATNTACAVQTGTLYMVTAAIERIIQDLNESFNNKIRFIITGGTAASLLPILGDQVVHYPDIVLKGLAFYARQADKKHLHKNKTVEEVEDSADDTTDHVVNEDDLEKKQDNDTQQEQDAESVDEMNHEDTPPLP